MLCVLSIVFVPRFCNLVLLVVIFVFFFFFKQKTAYEMRISDWSSDVCSSDLGSHRGHATTPDGLSSCMRPSCSSGANRLDSLGAEAIYAALDRKSVV